jgi:hypothetical protein
LARCSIGGPTFGHPGSVMPSIAGGRLPSSLRRPARQSRRASPHTRHHVQGICRVEHSCDDGLQRPNSIGDDNHPQTSSKCSPRRVNRATNVPKCLQAPGGTSFAEKQPDIPLLSPHMPEVHCTSHIMEGVCYHGIVTPDRSRAFRRVGTRNRGRRCGGRTCRRREELRQSWQPNL